MGQRPDDEGLAGAGRPVEQDPARRVDAHRREAFRLLHGPDHRLPEPLLDLAEVGDPIESVRRHLAHRHRPERRCRLGERGQQIVLGQRAARPGDHRRGVHDGRHDVGPGEPRRSTRQRLVVDLLGGYLAQPRLEQTPAALQVGRGDGQRAGKER